MPIIKHNFIVQNIEDLAAVVREASVIANSGRKDPVLINMPEDVTAAHSEYVKLPYYRIRKLPRADDVVFEQALEVIRRAGHLMTYAGGGTISSNATRELMNFSRHMDIPICCSMIGLDSVPYDYDLYMDMLGTHGTLISSHATLNTDLIIVIGSRFSNRVTGNREEFGREAKIIHFDIDTSEIFKNVTGDISIVGDARYILKKMIQRMSEIEHDDWTGTLKDFRTKLGLPKPESEENVGPRGLALTLHEIVGEDAIIVTDVGQYQMIMAQCYQFFHLHSWISSCGLGAMGYGMEAVIGARVINPHHLVILVTGDGSFHMNMSETAAAVSANIPIVVLAFNNHVLGMVRQWQTLFYDHRYSHTAVDRQTDLMKLAGALSGKGLCTQTRYDIKGVMKEALSSRVPCIVDCWIDKDDCAYPIIPPGKSGKDIILYGNQGDKDMNRAILSILVSSHFGVLAKVANLFSQKGFNVGSLAVGEMGNENYSHITITTSRDTASVNQIKLQLNKLEDVKIVQEIPDEQLFIREVMLVKVALRVNQMGAFEKCMEDFNGRTQIIEDGYCIVELADTPAPANYFLEELCEYHIKEISRTGGAALQLSTETVY